MVTRKQHGFTIIEVVLVLAIAGLIFLMVFIALPALQRGQRDTQRRQDMSTFAAQISSFQANNKGSIPATGCTTGQSPVQVVDFVSKYITTTWNDPQTGVKYTCATANPTAVGSYWYQTGYICDGETPTQTNAKARNFAVVTKLEGSGSLCQDNQ
jgi:prepilin-type N-terminal cleavage/methylation domain-containing protein